MSTRNRLMKIMSKLGPKKPQPSVEQAKTKTKWSVLRGDKVEVIGNHPERGKQGVVTKVLRKLDRVIVQGINMGTKYVKGDPDRGIKGRAIERERSIAYSKVNLIDPITGKPTRVGYKFLEDGTKVRFAKKSGAIIPRPEILTMRRRPVLSFVTDSDTTDEDVWRVTYQPSDANKPFSRILHFDA